MKPRRISHGPAARAAVCAAASSPRFLEISIDGTNGMLEDSYFCLRDLKPAGSTLPAGLPPKYHGRRGVLTHN